MFSFKFLFSRFIFNNVLKQWLTEKIYFGIKQKAFFITLQGLSIAEKKRKITDKSCKK